MYRLGLITIFILTVWILNAQTNVSAIQTDSIKQATMRNKKGTDTTFQQIYWQKAKNSFSKKNYALAAKYFSEELKSNPLDSNLQQELYHSYLLSGQKVKAEVLFKSVLPSYHKKSVIEYIALSSGYLVNNNKPKIMLHFPQYDSVNQYQNMFYTSLTLGLNITKRTKLTLGYQMYNTHFEQYGTMGLLQNFNLSQHQWIASLQYFAKNNISTGFSAAFYQIDTFNKQQFYSNNSSGNPPKKSSSSAFSVLAFINKRFVHLQPEISIAYSNFGTDKQYQAEGSLTYYPLGNLNLYGQTKLAAIHNVHFLQTNQFVFSQSVGVRLIKQLWLDGRMGIGNQQNYITEHSFLVYDTYNPIIAITGASLSYYFKKATISAGYQWHKREGYAYSMIDYTKYSYNNHLINIALVWNF